MEKNREEGESNFQSLKEPVSLKDLSIHKACETVLNGDRVGHSSMWLTSNTLLASDSVTPSSSRT